MWTIEPLREDQVELAGEVLARSFFLDPLALYMLPDEEDRKRLLPWHFSCVVRHGVSFGEVYTTSGDLRGAAIWLRPGELEMTEEQVVAAGFHEAPQVLGEGPWGRFSSAIQFLEKIHAKDLSSDHWYLMILGVDPEFQGQGLGCALIQPILDKADSEGKTCYMETAEFSNVPFYQKRGFRLLRDGVEPSSGVPYWTFCRDPR